MAESSSFSSTMLPEPALTFTLPSLHDGLTLDCRVYHPQSLSASPKSPPWRKHGAIVAHPYAPLGGSYDDPVVDIVAGTLLQCGFVVGTFNFRGAGSSAGRTTWTAKAESADYMSFAGFMSHYIHYLDPFRPARRELPTSDSEDHFYAISPPTSLPSSPLGSPTKHATSFFALPETNHAPILLLGGYSYGAMVTTNLPSLSSILAPFDKPVCGSPAAEIRLRAQHLAEMQNTVLASARAAAVDRQKGKSYRKSLGMRVGGDEENRRSHDSRRSFSVDLEERLHKGVNELMEKARKGHRRRLASGHHEPTVDEEKEPVPENAPEPEPERLLPVPKLTACHPAYLLVSPLQGIVTNLATMSFPSPLSSLSRRIPNRSSSWSGKPSIPETAKKTPLSEAEQKLVANPTLAIYGDNDGFVAARKLRIWASRLQTVPDSKFRAHEVAGVGHFWHQGRAHVVLREAIKTYADSLLLRHDV